MSFLTPLAFTLAILLPVIIAMYLLKLRRTEQLVGGQFFCHNNSPRDIIIQRGRGIDDGLNKKEWDLRFLLNEN